MAVINPTMATRAIISIRLKPSDWKWVEGREQSVMVVVLEGIDSYDSVNIIKRLCLEMRALNPLDLLNIEIMVCFTAVVPYWTVVFQGIGGSFFRSKGWLRP